MRVYFDISTLNPQKITGVGVYMLQLLREFSSRPDIKVVPVIKPSRIRNKNKIQGILPVGLKVQILWPWTLTGKKEAIYHGPDFKVNTSSSLPKVVTIHDMVVFERSYNEPGFYNEGIQALRKVLHSDVSAVVVNSEFTKTEVQKHFPHLAHKIHVTLLGCDRKTEETNVSVDVLTADPYVLFVGTLEKRKNIIGLIRAFEHLKSIYKKPLKLVLAGGWGFGEEDIRRALSKSTAASDIIHLHYVTNGQLIQLYKKAAVFLFPSFYEGFGIPVLEAMSYGCPVVISDARALKEIAGTAALSAPADRPKELAEQVFSVLEDARLRGHLNMVGPEQAARYSWARCADLTIQVYQASLRSHS